jgi:hypothetical protein
MGRPAPANLIGGVRYSIKALRGAGATRNVAARNFLEGPDAGYNGRRTGNNRSLSNVSKYACKPLAKHPRALATLITEAGSIQSPQSTIEGEQLQMEEFSRSSEYHYTLPTPLFSTHSLQKNPLGKESVKLSILQKGQPFFKELDSYQSQCVPFAPQ